MDARGRGRSACAALVAWAAVTIAAAGPVEGVFRLVEQRYENGAWNLAASDRPLRVEFRHAGGVLAGRIWAGGDDADASSWPTFANDAGPVPVEGVVVRENAATSEVSARYRVRPSSTDDLVLEVSEVYRLVEEGRVLEGTMTVRFTGGSTNRGGFTLHRRFERER